MAREIVQRIPLGDKTLQNQDDKDEADKGVHIVQDAAGNMVNRRAYEIVEENTRADESEGDRAGEQNGAKGKRKNVEVTQRNVLRFAIGVTNAGNGEGHYEGRPPGRGGYGGERFLRAADRPCLRNFLDRGAGRELPGSSQAFPGTDFDGWVCSHA